MEYNTIEHKGVITNIDNETVKVSIISVSACSGCHAKSMCTVADMKEKIIEIKDSSQAYHAGDEVLVYYKQNQGFHALFLGYILPLLVMVISLGIAFSITENEVFAGAVGIGFLIPYYLCLYIMRTRIQQKFHFHIRKL